jgi:PAS domain S-box-containing protein
MAGKLKVLMLEDVESDAQLSERELKQAGFQTIIERVETEDSFIAALKKFKPDIVLADYNLPTWDGMSALVVMREIAPETPFIFVSGTIGEDLAIEAMKSGATDYVLKTKLSKLGIAVERALEEEKMKMERARHESEVMALSKFPEENPSPVFRFGFDGRILYANKGAGPVLKQWQVKQGGLAPEHIRHLLTELKSKKTPKKIEEICGKSIYSIILTPILGRGYANGYGRDITDRKKAEDALRESEEIFRNFMDHSPIYVFFKDENIRTVRLSKNYESMLGKPLAELYGKSMNELFPSELANTMLADDKLILENGKTVTVEEEHDGRHYSTTKFPIALEGKPRYLAGYTIDITDRKRAEEQLHLKNRMLTSIADYTQAIAFAPPEQLFTTIVTKLKEITGAAEVLINDYDEDKSELVLRQTTLSEENNTWVRKKLGTKISGFKSPVSDEMRREMMASTIGRVGSLHDVSFGAIPKSTGQIIEKMFGVGWFIGLALKHKEKLVGTILIVGKKGSPELENEELLAYTSATANVLARRKAEINMAQSEERFRSLIEKSSDVIMVIGPDLNVSYLSSSYLSIFKRAPTELIGKNIVDFANNSVHEDDITCLLELFEACLATPESEKRMEFRFKSLDGTWHHLVAIGKNHLQTPSINGLVVNIRDITVQKKAREALQDSEQKFRQLAENINLVFWLTDWTEKKLLYVNKAYETIFGLSVESAYEDRLGWKKAVHPDDLARADAEFQSHAASGTYLELDYRIICDGQIKWIHEKALPLKDAKGQVIRYINVAEDITERKLAEESLAKNQALLQESQHLAKIGGWEFFVDTLTQTWTEETFRILEVEMTGDAPKVPEGVNFIAPEYRPMADKAIQRAMEFGEPYDQEWEVITAKGNRKWVRAVARVNRVGGKITSVSGSFQDITESKLSDIKLRNEEQKYRDVVETMNDVIFTLDLEGNVIDAGHSMLNVVGWSAEDLFGKPFSNYVHPGDLYLAESEFIKAIQGIGQPIEIRIVRPDKIPVWVYINALLIMRDGEPENLLCVLSDINERKLAEDTVKQNEERFRTIFQNSSSAMAIIERDTTISMVNNEYLKLSGYGEKEVIGMSWTEQIPPEDLERLKEYNRIRMVDPASAPDQYDFSFYRKDGTIRQCLMSVGVISTTQKIVCSFVDITERKQAEAELKQSNERFFQAFHSSPVLMSISDIETGKFIDVNEAMARTYGLPKDEIIGKISTELGVWTDPETRKKTLKEIKKHGSVKNIDFILKTRTGEIRNLLWSGEFVAISGKQCLLASALDITERKQLESELETYSEGLQIMVDEKTMELEKTHELLMKQERLAVLGQMAASVSHELRNPLSVINNVAYYLKMKFPDMDEKSVQMLDLLEKEVDRSDRIIGNMLSFSKQKPNLNKDMDLNDLVRTFFSAPDAIPGNVAINLKLSEIPTIRADAEKLRQVLDNLVSNACQAMPEGGTLTVSTKVNKAKMLEMSVKDTGQGMSDEIQSRIFEPLFSTKTTGFGLGLVIVKSLVGDHGGGITVRSKAGEGSEFTVTLPIEGRAI